MVKRGIKVVIFLGLLILLIVPLVSAGFFSDVWGKITGEATFGESSVNITIGNSAPTIEWVSTVLPLTPNETGINFTTFTFQATDTDGFANINTSSASAYFKRAGEATRFNVSCEDVAEAGNEINFSCTVGMLYFDENGDWEINVTIKDDNGAYGDNNTLTFSYNLVTSMLMSPTALGWPPISLSNTDTGSDTDPVTINNTANDVNLYINVTAIDLQGNDTLTQHIFAENFTVENVDPGCTGTTMVNNTATNVTSAILQRGNNSLPNYNNATSGQEQIFFCLKGVPQDISPQEYSSLLTGAWTVWIQT